MLTGTVDVVGAEAVDFGEPEAAPDLSESDSECGSSSPAVGLFKMFLISIHSLPQILDGLPAPRAHCQSVNSQAREAESIYRIGEHIPKRSKSTIAVFLTGAVPRLVEHLYKYSSD